MVFKIQFHILRLQMGSTTFNLLEEFILVLFLKLALGIKTISSFYFERDCPMVYSIQENYVSYCQCNSYNSYTYEMKVKLLRFRLRLNDT